MEVVQLSLLALLLHPGLVLSSQDLACVNDYINNITCVWNSSVIDPGSSCVLHGHMEGKSHVSCELKRTAGCDSTLRCCNLVFNNAFYSLVIIKLTVKCNNTEVYSIPSYSPVKHIKMHPPGCPVVVKSNVSWSRGEPFSGYIFSYMFQMQYKLAGQRWEEVPNLNISSMKMWVELNEDMLEKGALYQARVRVIPEKYILAAVWSNWSPIASWRSEVGQLPPEGWSLDLPIGVPCGVILLAMVVLLCHNCNKKWFYQVKWLHVPDPSKYFAGLHSIHGGNFQKWLSPMFSPEAFDILKNSEDISVLEVGKEKVSPAYLDYSHLAKHTDTSGHSTYSNLGYLYSKYPSSYEIESCSVYFSYRPGEGLPGGEKQGGVDDVDRSPLQTSSSYESLEKLGALQGQSEVGYSGFRTGSENQERNGENEEETRQVEVARLGEIVAHSTPANACPSSSRPPFYAAYPHPFHSFPQLSYSYPLPIDLDVAPSDRTPLELFGLNTGRFSSVKLEPSTGGYMSLQDMQDHGGNKSI